MENGDHLHEGIPLQENEGGADAVLSDMSAVDLSSPTRSPARSPPRSRSPVRSNMAAAPRPGTPVGPRVINSRLPVKAREVGGDHNDHGEPGSEIPATVERTQRESKLELFEVDPLVDVRGLKRYVIELSLADKFVPSSALL
jgi:hypothetical protein